MTEITPGGNGERRRAFRGFAVSSAARAAQSLLRRAAERLDLDDAREVSASGVDDDANLRRRHVREHEDVRGAVVAGDAPLRHGDPVRAVEVLHVEVLYAVEVGGRRGRRLDGALEVVLQCIDANLVYRPRRAEINFERVGVEVACGVVPAAARLPVRADVVAVN